MAISKMKKSSTYGKNLRRSAGKMAAKIAYTTMPSLSETVVSAKTAISDIKQFTLRGRSQLNVQNKYSKRTLLRPINEIIQNAKEDLKSGKFYNEDRINETQASGMSDFLGTMSGEDESYEDSNNTSMASLNKFMASTSANSMNSARAISDTQIKTAEYLGELSTSQHTQSLVFARQQHLEQMGKLDNLEKIGMSLAEFNTKTMSDHIKATHQFYNDILSETREMRKSIDSLAKDINSRYGTGGTKGSKKNALSDIFGGGSFDISSYFSHVKKNIGDQVPFSMDMIKGIFNDFKASPISGLMSLAGGFMMPNGIKRGAGKLDKSIQGLFAHYLNTMDQWKHGKNLSSNDFISTIQKLAGGTLSVDMTSKLNPDLSSYKNEKITLELEQKKAKAITEVIPSYLSQILKEVSGGKNEKYFNYTTGKFEDMKASREKEDESFRRSIKYSSDSTTEYFSISIDKIKFPNKKYKEAFKEDTDTFLIYMITNGDLDPNFIGSGAFYQDLLKKGLFFNLGEFSAKMLGNIWLSATPAKRQEMITDIISNRPLARDISNKRDVDLQSSGKSSLYNGLTNLGKNKKVISIDKDIQESLLEQSALVNTDMSDADRKKYKEKKAKDLGDSYSNAGASDGFLSMLKNMASKHSDSKIMELVGKLTDGVSKISNEIESKIDTLSDTLATKSESYLYGEGIGLNTSAVTYDDTKVETISPLKARAKKVAKKTINTSAPKVLKMKKVSSSPNTGTMTPGTEAVMSSIIDYRPYFESLDSHLRNIATILSQDKAIHVNTDTSTGSMTGMMSGASDKLKGLYSSGREAAGKIFSSLKTAFAGASTSVKSFVGSVSDKAPAVKEKVGNFVGNVKDKIPGGKDKVKGFLSKTKDTGLDFLSKIASGIKTAGGNVSEYLKSDSFKELLGGMKSNVGKVLSKGKEFAGTLFDKLKSGGGNLLKKGKGMAIGGAISSMLGLGPIPGAIIGTLFSKNKKKKDTSSEDNKQMDEIEKQEKSGGGFFDKFKAKKKKSVLMGAGISTMLGLGPIPGALLTMIFNKKFVKKSGEEKEEEKEAKDIAEGVEKAEKQSKGIGKGKKLKNLTIGAAASSILGLGPMPGVIAASIYNKHKDKAAKKKDKEESKQAEDTAEVMEDATNEKKKGEGILSKIKNFFGKGKNLAIGATASTLLGLGPFPGLIVASMYNKKKYKKKDIENEMSAEGASEGNALNETTEAAKDKVLSKTAESPEAKEQRKKNKEYIEHVKQARDAEANGNTDKADKLEKTLLNKAKSDGDIDTARTAQGLIADSKNSSGEAIKTVEKEKKEGLFSKLLGGLGGLFSGGGLSGILSALIPILGGGLLAYFMNKFGKDGEWSQTDYNVTKAGTGIMGLKAVKDMIFSGGKKGGSLYTAGQVFSGVNEIKRGHEESVNGDGLVDKTTGSAHIVRGTANISSAGMKVLGGAAKGFVKGGGLSKTINKTAFKTMTKGGNMATRLAAYKAAKETTENALTKGKTGITGKIVGWITKLIKGIATKVGKTKGGAILAKQAAKIGSTVVGKFAKNLAAKAATFLAKYGQPIGWVITIGQAVWDFISGWKDVRNIMETDSSYEPPTSLKITAGLSKALSNFLLGLIPVKWLTGLIFGLIASDAEKEELAQAQEKSKSEYEAFMEENPDAAKKGLTFEKYQQLTNVTTWGKVKNFFGRIFGKKTASLSDYTSKNQVNVNYDASENTTVMVSDSSGSGGRGPSLADQSASQIIKHTRDKLHKNIYSKPIKLTDDEVNKYVESPQYKPTNSKKKGYFNSLGETITDAAKWVKDKISSGWNWVKSTVGGWFGSGGRGKDSSISNTTNNNYTYYSQKDPKWANQTFGKYNGRRDTVKEGGCGPTVAAMALEQLTGRQVLPSTMADLAIKAGHKYDNGGTDPSFFNTAGSLYGIGFKQTPGFNDATINSLKAGVPVPLLGKNGPYGSGNHYILATGIDNAGNVSVLDPQNKSNNKKYSMKELSSTTNSSMVTDKGLIKAKDKAKNNKYVKYLRSFTGRGEGDRARWLNIVKAVKAAIAAQKPGYSQNNHINIKVDGITKTVRTDCSGFVGVCCRYFGVLDDKTNIWTGNMLEADDTFAKTGFGYKKFTSWKDLSPGDIVVNNVHTEIFAGFQNNQPKVYNCGNDDSVNNPGVNGIAYETYSCVWTPGEPGESAVNGTTVDSSSSSDGEGQTLIQSILSSIGIKHDSDYSKLVSMSLLKTVGGTKASAATTTNTTPSSKTYGTTSRTGTITLPDGLGKYSTYMGWQTITSPSSNQYRLREQAGMNFDSNGMAIIDGRYVVAVKPKFGDTGDYLTVKLSDGTSFKAIVGDIKANDPGSNEWGHNNGGSVVEAVVDKGSWYNKKNNDSIPWYGKSIVSITNEGNYWGRGRGYNNNASIIPHKAKDTIAAMRPSIPERMISGRGYVTAPVYTDGILDISKTALANKNTIKLNKTLTNSGRGDIGASSKSKSSSINSDTINKNNKEDLMISALQNIVSLLTDIRSSNKTISEKNFSPVIGVNSGSGGMGYQPSSPKSSLIDNIITGI